MNLLKTILNVLLLASFAIWFGGFGFYVSFVVPIGTEVLGSDFDQGMITRRVAIWLNVMCAVALLAMWLDWGIRVRRSRYPKTLLYCLAFLSICLLTLYFLHPLLDRQIDLSKGAIEDYDRFYFLHRCYLWVSTVQWLVAWGWLGTWLADSCINSKSDDGAIATESRQA